MKREKPQQQIYVPGSGPLRKSNTGIDDNESEHSFNSNSKQIYTKNQMSRHGSSEGTSNRGSMNDLDNTTARMNDMSLHQKDANRRQRKPEQPLYVPKPLAQARGHQPSSQEYDHNFYSNGNNEPDRYQNRSKKYSNRRRGNEGHGNDGSEEWRNKSSISSRLARQGSEPRGTVNGTGWQPRTRDTRSVEPNAPPPRNYAEKVQSKPPSGRRHSTIGLEPDKRYSKPNLDAMPPRFRKKLLEENMLSQVPTVEEKWDGNSMTFQGTSNTNKANFEMPNYATMPGPPQAYNQNMPINSGYYTLPHRPRGRGRLMQEYDTHPGMFHSMPADHFKPSPSNSRPCTPPIYNKSRNENYSRPHTPVQYHRNDNEDRWNSREELNVNKKGVFERLGRKSEDRIDDRRFNRDNNRGDNRRNGNHRRDRGGFNNRRDNNDNNYRRSDNDSFRGRGRNRNDNPNPQPKSPPKPPVQEVVDEPILSPVSPETPPPAEDCFSKYAVLDPDFDWSEEVERDYQLENEALSDALTRSSSVNSLVDVSTKSMPSTMPTTSTNFPANPKGSKNRRNRRNSRHRSGSIPRDPSDSRSRNQSTRSTDNKEFKVPQDFPPRRRRDSRDRRDSSYERHHNKSRNSSRDCSFDRHRNSSTSEHENWRDEARSRQNSEREGSNIRRSRQNSEIDDIRGDVKKPGVLVLPTKDETPNFRHPPVLVHDQPRLDMSRKSGAQQKSLFDPNNPNKPIIIKSQSSRTAGFTDRDNVPQLHNTEPSGGNIFPYWYNESSDEFKSCSYPELLRDVKRADLELQNIINSGCLLIKHQMVENYRSFLKQALEYLLCKALKFCQTQNVEQHFWKILYYNIIEITKKAIVNDPDNKDQYKAFLLYLIEEGSEYFEGLLNQLEETYQFKLNNYLGKNSIPKKGLKFVGLALVSAQKLFLFLGDLGRYKEQVNETSNYGKCRQWYIKSHEINPKNGKPYNQLAVLAVYARRKLDAVYYYMRSLMSSNPVVSARESLISLFDENRKKYEQGEKKRREERMERARQQMKQKESENNSNSNGSLRKETWIHPEGGKRVTRTTQSLQDQKDSEEEDLAALSSVEVNKRFVISYLHVHGKLITRIGMESFQEAAIQMLKEFRALLQHSPVPLPCNRFLQLLALNMFAIESTQFKDPQLKSQIGYRSEWQERALVVSLQMFNLILERCVSILQEHISVDQDQINSLPLDANVLLPAIKIWCDWMICHFNVWNPPPFTQDYKVGASGDAWSRLAALTNLLEQMDTSAYSTFILEERDGYELVSLPEDAVLCGFTPLMLNKEELTYAPKDLDNEIAQLTLRLQKLIFFGTQFLCGLDPPVLKLEIENDCREYISVVCASNSRDSPPSPQPLAGNNDVLLESISSDEEDEVPVEKCSIDTPSEIRDLLIRKEELEKKHRSQELHMQHVMKILSQSVVSVHIEVRPKYLVPDTNCFIDHLDRITTLASSHCYTLMVPIVVLSELEGLARGGKTPMTTGPRSLLDPQHVRRVGESAYGALGFLKSRQPSVKCVTTKGAILTSTTFTTEDDSSLDRNIKNDDKILATCIILCKGHKEPPIVEGEPRQLVRDVVLLTEDRNLRVKAHASDVPVRELPDFMKWAGLG